MKHNGDLEAKQHLVGQLNKDLAGELGAIAQYITYAAKVTGPYRPQLVEFLMAAGPDEQRHASFLANKIVALSDGWKSPHNRATELISIATDLKIANGQLQETQKGMESRLSRLVTIPFGVEALAGH